MTEGKRFQSQTLNNKDYEKTEKAAGLVRKGGMITAVCLLVRPLVKKHGPRIIKKIRGIRKI